MEWESRVVAPSNIILNLCVKIVSVLIISTCIVDSISLHINGSSSINNNFLGIGAVYQGFSFMPEAYANGMNSTYHDIEFSRVCNSGLKVARTWFAANWAMTPTFDNVSATKIWNTNFDWNSVLMNKFYSWLDKLQLCDIDIAIAGLWWFTQNICSSAKPSTCTPNDNDIDIYTQFISEALHQIINIRGFNNVKYLIYFTEPLKYESGILPQNVTQIDYYAYVLKKLNTRLVNDKTRKLIKIVGPNSNFSHIQQIVEYKNNDNEYIFSDIFDIYSGHKYDLLNYNLWYDNIITATKYITTSNIKTYWMDEYGAGNNGSDALRNNSDYGTYISFINIAALNANVSMTLVWAWEDIWFPWPLSSQAGSDAFYNGLHRWGFQYWLPYNTSVRPGYYAITLLTKYLNKGGIVLNANMNYSKGCVENVAFTAVQNKVNDSLITVLITNQNYNITNVTVNIYGLKFRNNVINKLIFYRHLYNPNDIPSDVKIIGIDKEFDCEINHDGYISFKDTLPSRGFAVYTTNNL
eukprot:324444_1